MATTTKTRVGDFDASRPWGLSSDVAVREESFGALCYHYGNRRLVFLKSRTLLAVVRALDSHDSAEAAIAANCAEGERMAVAGALATLVSSEVIYAR